MQVAGIRAHKVSAVYLCGTIVSTIHLRRAALCFSVKAFAVPHSPHGTTVYDLDTATGVATSVRGAALETVSAARYLKAQVDFTAMLKAEKRRIAEQRAISLAVRAPLPHNRVVEAGNLLHYALRRAQSALYLTCTNAMDVDGQLSTICQDYNPTHSLLTANCPTPHDCKCAGIAGLRSSINNLAKAIVEVNAVSDALQTATNSATTDHSGRLQSAAQPAPCGHADIRTVAEEASYADATELAGVGAAEDDQRGSRVYEADTSFDDVDDYDEWREKRKKQQRENVEQTLRMLAELKSVLQAREH